jgi:hypothetical protein
LREHGQVDGAFARQHGPIRCGSDAIGVAPQQGVARVAMVVLAEGISAIMLNEDDLQLH